MKRENNKSLFIAAVTFFSLLLTANAQADSFHLRIINGNPSNSDRPWMVSISPAKTSPHRSHFCGGALINRTTVLTAAHCVMDFVRQPFLLRAVIGRSRLSGSGGEVIPINGIVVHPAYRSSALSNDVALLTLASPSSVTSFPKVAETLTAHNQGKNALILGWGRTAINQHAPSDQLQEAIIPLVHESACRERLGDDFDPTQMICGGTLASTKGATDGVDACQGDSGGPILAEEDGELKIIGLTSWGIDCAGSYYWGVYARADAHRSWIFSNPIVAPYAISPPHIIGKPVTGQKLRCKAGVWGGDEEAKISYRWIDAKRGPISGARNEIYKLRRADKGKQIVCEVKKQSVRHSTAVRSRRIGPIR